VCAKMALRIADEHNVWQLHHVRCDPPRLILGGHWGASGCSDERHKPKWASRFERNRHYVTGDVAYLSTDGQIDDSPCQAEHPQASSYPSATRLALKRFLGRTTLAGESLSFPAIYL
jgi:hypothetical protein